MASQLTSRLEALERVAYAPAQAAALQRIGQRARAIWPAEEVERLRADCLEALERGIMPPDVLARIQSDEELGAAWREFCRISWLQFNSEVHGIASEHDYFTQA